MKVTELNNYAIGVGDITEALRSSSANLAMTNTSLEQSVGLITASYEVLQDSGRVGNGLDFWAFNGIINKPFQKIFSNQFTEA